MQVRSALGLILLSMASAVMADQALEVDRLLAMSLDERRAALKAMPAEERSEVWFAVKREQANRRGSNPVGFYRAAEVSGAKNKEDAARPIPIAGKAVGTITYDDGVITNSFGGGAIIGNRFDTHTGIPVFASGQVSTVQAVVVQGPAFTTSSVGVIVLGPQTGGGGANAIFNTTVTASGTTDTITVTGIGASYTGSSFFAVISDFASGYVPAFGTGTNLGQGGHGMVGYTGGMFPNFTSTFDFGGALNGLVRATGNIVPVELMQFTVD